jgi:murein DD-endopeptidase MepM/ murein hydrolase activator NlpD
MMIVPDALRVDRPSSRNRIFAFVLVTLWSPAWLPAAAAVASPAIDVQVTARSFTPGELVLIAISTDVDLAAVGVDLFGRRTTAYKVRPGQWEALAGIDLDQHPGAYIATVDTRVGSTVLSIARSIVVRPRAFPVRRLRVDPEFVNPPTALLDLIASEAAFIRDVTAGSATERLWTARFLRPVPDIANSRFGTRSIYNGESRRPHAGTDFLSAAGTPVKAPNAGRVVCARELFFTGNTVIVDHGLGAVSLLAHLSSMYVHEGDRVVAGQPIGRVGATGRVTGPHLHWALTIDGARVDPLSALALLGADGH